MANKLLIQGEKGLRGPVQINSELITKPITKALDDYKKQEALRQKQGAAIRNAALKQVTNKQGKVSVKITDPNIASLGFNEFNKHKANIASDYLNQQYQYDADRFSADFNTAVDGLDNDNGGKADRDDPDCYANPTTFDGYDPNRTEANRDNDL